VEGGVIGVEVTEIADPETGDFLGSQSAQAEAKY
jgi:hypothetical protein